MSAYSALILAANQGVRPPTPEEARALFLEVGVLDLHNADEEFGNLATQVGELFDDADARSQNDGFFAPDTISLASDIDLLAPDGDYSGPGWCVRIHGNGYFFPWTLAEVGERATRSPILTRLREAVEARFGGRFVFPTADEEFLRERLIEHAGGWAWFGSESL